MGCEHNTPQIRLKILAAAAFAKACGCHFQYRGMTIVIPCDLRLLMLHGVVPFPSAAQKGAPIDSIPFVAFLRQGTELLTLCRVKTYRLQPATAAAILWNVELATS